MERSPMRDFDPEDQRRRLPEAVRILHSCSARAGVLSALHRRYPIAPSLAAVAYLTWIEGQPLDGTPWPCCNVLDRKSVLIGTLTGLPARFDHSSRFTVSASACRTEPPEPRTKRFKPTGHERNGSYPEPC